MTKISQLSSIGDSLAIGDQFLIRDIDDAGSPNKSVTVSGITRALDLGTAAAPAIAFASDKNTGIYSPGADQLAVATNGVQRLTTDTAAVTSTLPVVHPLGAVGTPSITFTGDLNTGFWSPTADTLAASTAGSERLRITSAGLVGIGTSSPGAQVDVVSGTSYSNIGIRSTGGFAVRGDGRVDIGAASGANSFLGVQRPSGSSVTGLAYLNDANTSTGIAIGTSSGFANISAIGSTAKLALGNTGVNTQQVVLDTATGRVGIGTTSPSTALDIRGAGNTANYMSVGDSIDRLRLGYRHFELLVTNRKPQIIVNTSGDLDIASGGDASSNVIFHTGNGSIITERARIDSSGRLLVGTSTARSNFYNFTTTAPRIQNEAQNTNDASYASIFGGAAGSGAFVFARHRGSIGAYTVVQDGDILGRLSYQGGDGAEFVEAAFIAAEVDGTPGSNDMPGRLVFSTTADGASSPTERMRINALGEVIIGKTANTSSVAGLAVNFAGVTGRIGQTVAANYLQYLNRQDDDGDIIRFAQADTVEGSISVSGTTVSYNGAHLSRWSQLPSGAERTEILRGSVLSNLDEMCEWGEEDNEQLNRMKVSDVEGDKNVSGVFQCWDDDDDTYTNDFYCAMTGDFIIRIAEGVTVERGDLLMSAGDGTAKPQDDDIIRSKTIAKVTSTNVSCTYEDGSYCVPCVLMAC